MAVTDTEKAIYEAGYKKGFRAALELLLSTKDFEKALAYKKAKEITDKIFKEAGIL